MGARVLVAEDEVAVSRLLVTILECEGYTVHTVSNGPAVLAALQSFAPDIVLLDVMMPGLDGLTVLKKIRAAETTSRVPVVVLTARDDAASTWEGWRSGCDYYMAKPFDPDALCATIHRLLVSDAQEVSL